MEHQLGGPQRQALAPVASSASGEAVDPSLRVTLNFHPDRWLAGLPILESLARDGIYRSRSNVFGTTSRDSESLPSRGSNERTA